MSLVHSISGLRATLGDHLTPQNIVKYVSAFHKVTPEGKIIIGNDGRPSGKWIEPIVAGTLAAFGREVEIIGICPTPTVQLAVELSEAAGGIAITASHNPEIWNGLKFLNKDGVFLGKEEHEAFCIALDIDDKYPAVPHKPSIKNVESILDKHIEKVLSIPVFKKGVMEEIRKRKFKVVVDAVNASGSIIVPDLLRELNCEVIELFCSGSGIFPHIPEPLPENLTQLAEAVLEHNADIGIAVDPDADRLVLIDENGFPIGEEKTIVLAVRAALESKDDFKGYSDTVTVNHSTTRLVDDMAARFGAFCRRSPVGEINVVHKMKQNKSLIGGEGSGGVILPACHYGRDSLVGIGLIISLMGRTGMSLSSLAVDMPEYKMIKYKTSYEGDFQSLIPKIIEVFPDAEIIEEDGIKIYVGKDWVQARASNTEPIIRIIAEASTEAQAIALIDKIKNIT